MNGNLRRLVIYAILVGAAAASVAIPAKAAVHPSQVPSLSYPDEDWPPPRPEPEPATPPPPPMGPGCPVCL
jgi:hypothetical protein